MSKTILFSLVGAATGVFASYALHIEDGTFFMYLFGIISIVLSFFLLWGKQSTRFSVIYLSIATIIVGLLISWSVWREHESYSLVLLYYSLLPINIIAITFAQSLQSTKPHYPYHRLFENGWNNHFFFLFAILLTIGFLLILLLGTKLFGSIGLNLDDIIWNKTTTPVIIASLIGAGIGISRQYEDLIFKIRGVFFAIFHVMGYLTAVIVILFAISLPFTWQSLFTNSSTSIILLSLVAVSIVFLNTWVDGTQEDDKNRIFMAQIILLPFLSLLSVVAVILRINQYGLMPNRILALSVAVVLSLYTISYAYQLLKQRGHWRKGITLTNPILAVISLVVLIALISPVLDPVRLSVNNQLDRLKNNITSIEDFDFSALKYRLGKDGKNAIKEILEWKDHLHYQKIKQNASSIAVKNKEKVMLTLLDETPPYFEKLKKNYSAYDCNSKNKCFVTMMDMDRDGKKEVVVVRFNRAIHIRIDILAYQDSSNLVDKGRWVVEETLSSFLKPKESKEAIFEALKAGKLKPLRPIYDDLQLEGIKFRR
ncbi:MAG: DUF4153 domain-containing protein [Thiotrichaceae bacterium]|nr:DUF4153 domain-containing protein [Thiotrichaceae bacterium]